MNRYFIFYLLFFVFFGGFLNFWTRLFTEKIKKYNIRIVLDDLFRVFFSKSFYSIWKTNDYVDGRVFIFYRVFSILLRYENGRFFHEYCFIFRLYIFHIYLDEEILFKDVSHLSQPSQMAYFKNMVNNMTSLMHYLIELNNNSLLSILVMTSFFKYFTTDRRKGVNSNSFDSEKVSHSLTVG